MGTSGAFVEFWCKLLPMYFSSYWGLQRWSVLGLLGLGVVGGGVGCGGGTDAGDAPRTAAEVRAQLELDVNRLTAPEMAGRETGTPG